MMQTLSIDTLSFQRVLGEGGFGQACLYTTQDGKNIVVKTIKKQLNTQLLTQREIKAGKLLQHKHIAKFYGDWEDKENDFLAFELIDGMDLFKYFQERQFVPFSERESRKIFRQLASAVKYCHDNGVVHLDIKLDNIMYNKSTQQAKFIDFGLCNFINKENGGYFTSRVGSEEYWPAEIVPEKFVAYSGVKIDVWCLGVVLYCLLHAGFPYDYKRRISSVREYNLHPTVKFNFNVSSSVRDLINKMLEINPEKRIGMDEVLRHPWVKKSFLKKIWKL